MQTTSFTVQNLKCIDSVIDFYVDTDIHHHSHLNYVASVLEAKEVIIREVPPCVVHTLV